MYKDVVLVEEKHISLVDVYIIRGVNVDSNGFKKVVCESGPFSEEPTPNDIAEFLIKHPEATMCSVMHNYYVASKQSPDEIRVVGSVETPSDLPAVAVPNEAWWVKSEACYFAGLPGGFYILREDL